MRAVAEPRLPYTTCDPAASLSRVSPSGRPWAPGKAPDARCASLLGSFVGQCCMHQWEETVDVEVDEPVRAAAAHRVLDLQEPAIRSAVTNAFDRKAAPARAPSLQEPCDDLMLEAAADFAEEPLGPLDMLFVDGSASRFLVPLGAERNIQMVSSFLIDNSVLQVSDRPGIAYRYTKKDFLKVPQEEMPAANWGDVVQGADEGDGWLAVNGYYLPMSFQGVQIITPVPEDLLSVDYDIDAELGPPPPRRAPAWRLEMREDCEVVHPCVAGILSELEGLDLSMAPVTDLASLADLPMELDPSALSPAKEEDFPESVLQETAIKPWNLRPSVGSWLAVPMRPKPVRAATSTPKEVATVESAAEEVSTAAKKEAPTPAVAPTLLQKRVMSIGATKGILGEPELMQMAGLASMLPLPVKDLDRTSDFDPTSPSTCPPDTPMDTPLSLAGFDMPLAPSQVGHDKAWQGTDLLVMDLIEID